ncbi:MAG TPA: CBS domain-containing protein [candidate division Zixibacteria bacterium]|nr:CBS domain-containing protein [candidate division Zixibacteria bacterium]
MPSEEQVPVRAIMVRDVVTLECDDVLDVADDIMTLGRIRHLPVLEQGRVVGVLSQRDLFHSALVKVLGFKHREQKDLMKTVRVKEVMSKPVITISPDASIKEAARLLMEKKIGCLPVVEEGKFVGMVTETDIMRYLAEH